MINHTEWPHNVSREAPVLTGDSGGPQLHEQVARQVQQPAMQEHWRENPPPRVLKHDLGDILGPHLVQGMEVWAYRWVQLGGHEATVQSCHKAHQHHLRDGDRGVPRQQEPAPRPAAGGTGARHEAAWQAEEAQAAPSRHDLGPFLLSEHVAPELVRQHRGQASALGPALRCLRLQLLRLHGRGKCCVGIGVHHGGQRRARTRVLVPAAHGAAAAARRERPPKPVNSRRR